MLLVRSDKILCLSLLQAGTSSGWRCMTGMQRVAVPFAYTMLFGVFDCTEFLPLAIATSSRSLRFRFDIAFYCGFEDWSRGAGMW